MTLQIVLYNIMTGGEGRADPLAEVVLAQNPDVVAVIEAITTRGEDAPLRRLARRLDMEFVTAASSLDSTHAVALLSRFPIVRSVDWSLAKGLDQPTLLADVDVPDAGGASMVVSIVVTHMKVPVELPTSELVLGTFESPIVIEGFVDANDLPTRPTTPAPTDRVDRILLSPNWHAQNVRIETDRLATYASDHYPVVARLRRTSAAVSTLST